MSSPTKAELQAQVDRLRADREWFASWCASMNDWRVRHAEEDRRYGRELADLRVIIRDQRRHIASLEEQLAPLLLRRVEDEGTQEALI